MFGGISGDFIKLGDVFKSTIALNNDEDIVQQAVLSAYDVRNDSKALKKLLQLKDGQNHFDMLRRHYLERREFTARSMTYHGGDTMSKTKLKGLGFKPI